MPSTFGGMGEAAVTANEAINILYDEGLIENAENDLLAKLMVIIVKNEVLKDFISFIKITFCVIKL